MVAPDESSSEESQPTGNNEAPTLGKESHPTTSSGERPVDDAACSSVSPFSYAELGEMLKRIPPGSDAVLPSSKMFEAAETV